MNEINIILLHNLIQFITFYRLMPIIYAKDIKPIYDFGLKIQESLTKGV